MQLKQTLIIAFALSVLSLTAWEFFWRSEGFYPTLDDNEALWAVQRNRIKRQANNMITVQISMLVILVKPKFKKLISPKRELAKPAVTIVTAV